MAQKEIVLAMADDLNSYLPLTGGTLSKSGINALKIERTVNDVVNSVGFGINGVATNGTYPAVITLNRDNVQTAFLLFNENVLRLRDVTNGKNYNIFGEHNTALLAETIKELFSGGEIGVVKHIERGTVSVGRSTTVTLSGFTDIGKMVVYLDGQAGYYGNNYSPFMSYISDLTTTSLTITASTYSNIVAGTMSYQVVEFY